MKKRPAGKDKENSRLSSGKRANTIGSFKPLPYPGYKSKRKKRKGERKLDLGNNNKG